ncbi:MAG: hypothetical protein GW802_38535, partial [Armatimonadetes bacterium]|nr:hypothetical protein [Armatimonadota bacterium]
MKKDRHPYHRFLVDTRFLDGTRLGALLDRFARVRPSRCAYRESRQRLAAESGRASWPVFARRTAWVLGYAASVAAAAVFAYAQGLDKGLQTAQLANPLPVIALSARSRPEAEPPPKPRRRKPRPAHTRVKPAPAEEPTTSSEELANAARGELPVVEQSAQAYDALAASVSDPERKLEALSRAADIYGTILNDNSRAVSTYRHKVAVCERVLGASEAPGALRRTVDDPQRERLRLHLEKARLEIALARGAPPAAAPRPAPMD